MEKKNQRRGKVNRDSDLEQKTQTTRRRYDRIAPVYDAMEWIAERSAFEDWRERLWSQLPSGRILEVGVGTGKNMPYYPKDAKVTAIDLSERMLERARRRSNELDLGVELYLMDVQEMDFPDGSFDAVAASFVFCSVPDPIRGLEEVERVIKPDGDLWLLEHVRINRPVIGPIMDFLNPLIVPLWGANINRRTVENVDKAGFQIIDIDHLLDQLVKLIHAKPSRQPNER